jgi:hypothetical protein
MYLAEEPVIRRYLYSKCSRQKNTKLSPTWHVKTATLREHYVF